MFGIGSTAKKLKRALSRSFADARLFETDLRAFTRVKLVELETVDIGYFFHVDPARKAIYVEVPKVASSYILSQFAELGGREGHVGPSIHKRSDTGLSSPFDLGPKAFAALLDDPDLFVFTAVRDPFARLVSGYLDKFDGVVVGDGSYVSEVVLGFHDAIGEKAPEGRPLTFAEFVEMACRWAPVAYDGHWARQSRIVPRTFLKPKVLKFERLAEDLPAVFERLGAAPEQVARIAATRPKTTSDRVADFFTPALVARVADAFAEDFARFDYPTSPPTR